MLLRDSSKFFPYSAKISLVKFSRNCLSARTFRGFKFRAERAPCHSRLFKISTYPRNYSGKISLVQTFAELHVSTIFASSARGAIVWCISTRIMQFAAYSKFRGFLFRGGRPFSESAKICTTRKFPAILSHDMPAHARPFRAWSLITRLASSVKKRVVNIVKHMSRLMTYTLRARQKFLPPTKSTLSASSSTPLIDHYPSTV